LFEGFTLYNIKTRAPTDKESWQYTRRIGSLPEKNGYEARACGGIFILFFPFLNPTKKKIENMQ